MENGLTFQDTYKLAQSLVQDNTTAAQDSVLDPLTFLKQQINIGNRILYNDVGSVFLEKTKTYTTSISSNSYDLPADCARPKSLYRIVSNTRYTAERIFDEDRWQRIQLDNNTNTSDYLQFMFARRSTFEIWPLASTAAATLYLTYETIIKDLSADDYTTGTITTLANAGTAITASGTTFTAAMAGRFIKIDSDGQWYEIESVTDTTHLVLVKPYEGTAISAGSEAFTLGEMSRLPGATHHIPAYFAAWQYFLGFRRNKDLASVYERMYKTYHDWAVETFNKPFESTYIAPKRNYPYMRNPNFWPINIG